MCAYVVVKKNGAFNNRITSVFIPLMGIGVVISLIRIDAFIWFRSTECLISEWVVIYIFVVCTLFELEIMQCTNMFVFQLIFLWNYN